MSSFLNFPMIGNKFANLKGYDNVYQMDQVENPQDWSPTDETLVGQLWNEAKTAAKNWWYKNTGRAHLTDEYQYEQHLADTSYQRAAADMEAAGLSKFGGVGSASSPSPESGNGLLATALAAQQLKTAKLNYDVDKYNFGKAKEWGVSTDAAGEFAKYDGIAKLITGKSISELINNEGGLFGWIKDAFSNIPEDSPFGFLSNVFGGAKTDELQQTLQSLPADGSMLPPVDYKESSAFGFKKGEYPSLFTHPDFYSGIIDNRYEDGTIKLNSDSWNMLKDLAEVSGWSFDDMKDLLYDWLQNGGGTKYLKH